ncbi:pyridoxal phosphate-dependent transferase [Apodospora peruviana]|uniref:Molybdenum cofactor sulfurase n=1 Tax=Apodospora peruviana TaxID=516989 RepID=A0AAE0IPV5_9PEZI|nr:pyridoxal phosphate-dependent transferase [Apodospora peruviana]
MPMATPSRAIDSTGYIVAVEDFRDEEYPMLRGSIYLDHAGTTPYSKSLMDRFAQDMTSNLFGNPHSASASSQRSTLRIEDIRLRVLQFFSADPEDFDVVFVPNTTAGIKLVTEAMRALPGRFDYAYHQLSHTSLVGVREEARNSVCLDSDQIEGWIAGRSPFEDDSDKGSILFAYPAQSNMDGRRLPLTWAKQLRTCETAGTKNTYTLLDAAAYVCSSPLDLSCVETAPDFTVLSFYKVFGFPDLGALIVRREAEEVFASRKYFGGGTIDMAVCLKEQWHAPKSQFLHERLEDGTLPIHSIIALDAALDVHSQLFGSMADVANHTSFLARRLYDGLLSLRHGNGEPVCIIYSSDPDAKTGLGNGPVVAFNIRNSLGAWLSLAEFEKLATLKQFHIRTGGLCNPGGIASALGLEPWEMKQNFTSGFRCGTDNDIMSGKPTGVIRASLGVMSTVSDVDSFVDFVREFYRDELLLPSINPEPILHTRYDSTAFYVQAISVYPIKSCGGFQVPAGVDWEVRPEGLAWDREWCLVHRGSGQALSQKRHPQMALIRPSLDFGRGELRVTYAGHVPRHLPTEITVPLSKNPTVFQAPTTFRSMSSRVCGEEIMAQTYASSDINDFFSGVLGVPCVLARFPPGGQGKSMRHSKAHLQRHQQITTPEKLLPTIPGAFPVAAEAPPSPPDSDSEKVRGGRILLSNESPILAINTASLESLNKEIVARGGKKVSPAVFRANVVVAPSSSGKPYQEDSWSSLRIGDRHDFRMLGSCRRCHMVCINQETAQKSEEPFVTLSKTRRFDGKVFFGTHMCYSSPTVGAGDEKMLMLTKEMQYPTIRLGDSVKPT